MADIHLLESTFSENGAGTIRTVFHVPNEKTNNYPGVTESVVPGISQAELDALVAGTLVEVVRSVKDNIGKGEAGIKTRIPAMWQGVADETQAKLDKDYAFYGIELARAA